MSSVTPDGKEVMRRRYERGFSSRGALASHIDELCELWGYSQNQVPEGREPLFSFVSQLRAEGRTRPEVVSESAIRDVERGNDCRADTLLSIAYGLGLSSFELLLKRETPHVNLERDVSGSWVGHECQAEGLPKKHDRLPVTLELSLSGRTCLQGRYQVTLGKSSFAFDIRGELCFGRFVRFDYRSTDMASIRFGSYILELNGAGDELSGRGVGYSAFGERITTATVDLRRTKR